MTTIDPEVRKNLISAISRADSIFFIGAGLGFDAEPPLPSWQKLLLDFAQFCDDLGQDTHQARIEINKNSFYEAAGYLKSSVSYEQYKVFMESVEFADAEPHRTHELLMSFPSKKMITTNYDLLIEKAYMKERGISSDDGFVILNSDLAEHSRDMTHGNRNAFLFKLHGCITDLNSIILSHEDYAKLMIASPAVQLSLQTLFTSKPIIMIGFGLDDLDFNQLTTYINTTIPDLLEIYAFAHDVTTAKIDRWKKTHCINIIPYDLIDNNHSNLQKLLLEILTDLEKINQPTVNTPPIRFTGALAAALKGGNAHWEDMEKRILGHTQASKRILKSELHQRISIDGFAHQDIENRAETLVHAGLLLETENFYLSMGNAAAEEAAIYIEDELIQMLEGEQ